MSGFNTGDLVVLTCGSMRMAVEAVDGDNVACVWCHEGEIGRDSFNARLLKKWEVRDEGGYKPAGDRGGYKGKRDDDRGGDRGGYKGKRDDRGDTRDDDRKPRGKTGWDGKPREKKYFRKDD